MEELEKMEHVYFYSLPSSAEFLHKGDWYIKTDLNKAFNRTDKKEWTFEDHYGCFIEHSDFLMWKLSQNHIRPLNLKLISDESGHTIRASIENIIEGEVDCPLPIEVIPNMMDINLSAVDTIEWRRQEDGQLTHLKINFKPGED